MKLFDADDHRPQPADPERFSGRASMAHMDRLSEQPAVNMYRVAFEPSARTAWHAHSGVQLLLIIEGRCRVQQEGEANPGSRGRGRHSHRTGRAPLARRHTGHADDTPRHQRRRYDRVVREGHRCAVRRSPIARLFVSGRRSAMESSPDIRRRAVREVAVRPQRVPSYVSVLC